MNSLLRRYRNMQTLKWNICLLLVSVILPIWFYSDMIEYYPEGCIMDALNILPQSTVFPVLALIYGIWNVQTLQKDNNVMIVLLYSDRKKLWNSKCVSAVVTAFISSLLVVFGSMVSAGMYYDEWCNWGEEDSFFMKLFNERNIAEGAVLNPVIISMVCITTFFLLFWLTAMIGMLVDAIAGNMIISILFLTVISCMDSMVNISQGVPVLYCRYQVNLLMWIQPYRILQNTSILCALIFLVYMAGKLLFERRENI